MQRKFLPTAHLQGFVVLEDLLDSSGASVVLVTDDVGVENTGGGVKRVDGGVNAQLGDTAGQHGGRVQMGEGRGRSRVSQIVGRHVDGLARG